MFEIGDRVKIDVANLDPDDLEFSRSMTGLDNVDFFFDDAPGEIVDGGGGEYYVFFPHRVTYAWVLQRNLIPTVASVANGSKWWV